MTSTDKPPKPLFRWEVAHTWDGAQTLSSEIVTGTLARTASGDLEVCVDAPFHADPAPQNPQGPLDRLWEHEVAEVFILGDNDRYTELELGPHGHYLLICLHGYRKEVSRPLLKAFDVSLDADAGRRWRGRAVIAQENLPPGAWRMNAYAIHGQGSARRYLAAYPTGGDRPDFHRLDAFSLPLHAKNTI